MRFKDYYRKITARFPKKQLLLLLTLALSLTFLALLTFFALGIGLYMQAKNERTRELKKLAAVEKQITVTPDYPSLYITAAIAAARVGNQDKAFYYATQAYKLDPLNAETLQLKQTLGN